MRIRAEGNSAAKVGLFIAPPKIEFLNKSDEARSAVILHESEAEEPDKDDEGDEGEEGDEGDRQDSNAPAGWPATRIGT